MKHLFYFTWVNKSKVLSLVHSTHVFCMFVIFMDNVAKVLKNQWGLSFFLINSLLIFCFKFIQWEKVIKIFHIVCFLTPTFMPCLCQCLHPKSYTGDELAQSAQCLHALMFSWSTSIHFSLFITQTSCLIVSLLLFVCFVVNRVEI